MTEPIRIRVRTNFAVNSKSISHEQTVEIDAPVEFGPNPNSGDPRFVPLVILDGKRVAFTQIYERVLEEARQVESDELERRKAQFLAPVVA
jgi:hypothetical protein